MAEGSAILAAAADLGTGRSVLHFQQTWLCRQARCFATPVAMQRDAAPGAA
jgi:hypothetical protein